MERGGGGGRDCRRRARPAAHEHTDKGEAAMGRDIREREKEAKTVAGRPSNTRGRKQEQQLASRALKWVHFPVSGAHTLSVSSSFFFRAAAAAVQVSLSLLQ